MNSKTAKKLRKIAVVYGVSFKDVERAYKEQGEAFIKKYEERGGLNHYGQLKNEIKKAEVKAFNEVMAEMAAKEAEEAKKKDGPEIVAVTDGAGRPLKFNMKDRTIFNEILEGGDAKDTDNSAVISD